MRTGARQHDQQAGQVCIRLHTGTQREGRHKEGMQIALATPPEMVVSIRMLRGRRSPYNLFKRFFVSASTRAKMVEIWRLVRKFCVESSLANHPMRTNIRAR